MKKTLSILLSILMLMSITAGLDLSAYAATHSGTCGNDLTWELNTDTGEIVISGRGDMDYYDNAESPAPWYNYKDDIRSVVVEENVWSVTGGFRFCPNIEKLTFADTLQNISSDFSESAFYKNKDNWDNGVLYAGKHLLEADASGECTIRPGTLTICNRAFANSDVTSVTIPDSVKYINNSAFFLCRNLESVTLGNGVLVIGDYAFEHCYKLTSINIPDSVYNVGEYAFDQSKITDIYYNNSYENWLKISGISNNNEAIDNATIHCTDSTIAKTSDGYRYVAKQDGSAEILSYTGTDIDSTVPTTIDGNKVNSIRAGAFISNKLETLTIGSNINNIVRIEGYGYSITNGCPNLKMINVDGENPIISSVDGVLFNKEKTEIINYPIGNTRKSYTLPATVKTIYDGTFCNCQNLESVSIPVSVTVIGNAAFGYSTIKDVYYDGTKEQWAKVYTGYLWEYPQGVMVHYAGEAAPTTTPSTDPVTTPEPAPTPQPTPETTTQQTAKPSDKKNVTVPKISIKSAKSKKSKQIAISWSKNTKVNGYEIQLATDKSFKKNIKKVTVKSNKTTSKTIKGLKAKKKYYVRIRAYKTVNGKKYYSAWSKAKTVTSK